MAVIQLSCACKRTDYLGVGAFSWLYMYRTVKERQEIGSENRYDIQSHRSDSNPGLLRRGHNPCTWGECSTNWASELPEKSILALILG